MEYKELVETLGACPGYGTDNNLVAIAHDIRSQHPTHQANIVRNMVQILAELADSPTDLRNEGAVKLCQEIKSLDKFVPYI